MNDDASFLDLMGDTKAANVGEKSLLATGTSVAPSTWSEPFHDSLWETLTFQRNVNYAPRGDTVGLSLALQCSDRKAQDIAKADLQLWRRYKADRNRWELVDPEEHWLAEMLATQPNEFHTWDEFWRMVVIHFDFTQQAFILKVIDRQGVVKELLPLPTGICRPLVAESGAIYYEIASVTEFDRSRIGSDYLIVPADRVIHLKGRMYDGLNGLSNRVLGGSLFDLLGAVAKFQRNLFNRDGQQPIVFESDSATFGIGEQAEAAFERLKRQLTDRARKMAQYGDPILLEAGYKAKIIAQNARDAMTTESYAAVVRQVCGLMNMMPHKIFQYEGVKYDNQAAADNQYANQCLFPITEAIQKRFERDLLPREEWWTHDLEFEQMPLLAGDPKTMTEILDRSLKNGSIEIDEYREFIPLNLNPLPNGVGKVRLVPVNTAIVDRDGTIIAVNAKPATDAAAPDADEDEEAEDTAANA